ncbi:MAG: marine proteobacterial sortase target protein [Nitrospinota bacterium]|nr:marine proteobacterial sortase target protein [Nitrospinota bacterium]
MRTKSRVLMIITCFLFMAPVSTMASAVQETELSRLMAEPGVRGLIILRNGDPDMAPLLSSHVRMTVTGPLVRARVSQEFHNPWDQWTEGVYVFPLPAGAAVDGMRLLIGGRVIEGVVQEKKEAKKIYSAAKAGGKRAGLMDQNRPNIFTISVANIEPGGRVTVEIEYQQMVMRNQGISSLRFPMVVGPRYIPGAPIVDRSISGLGWAPDTDQVPDASAITPPVNNPAEGKINPVTLEVDLMPGYPMEYIRSATHKIKTPNDVSNRVLVTLDGSNFADGDFSLEWKPAVEAPEAAIFTENTNRAVYSLLTLTPPAAVPYSTSPREVIFVLDISGSMAGESIKQARGALLMALDRLKETDTFNVIAFDDRQFPLFPRPIAADRAAVARARKFVQSRNAKGGTEIHPALILALSQQGSEQGRLTQIVFLTDGSVGNEQQALDTIRDRAGSARLFTVGIGSAPNGYFMEQAARRGRGTYTFINTVAEVEEKMTSLFRKLESPALTDIRLGVDGGGEVELFPYPIPDLYIGEPAVVAVRSAHTPARFLLKGRIGAREWSASPDVATEERPGVGKLWARWKIDSLMERHNRTIGGPDADGIRQAVVDLSVEHHLVSKFTSMVAVDVTPARPDSEGLTTHAMKTNMPRGWEYGKVFSMAKTATSAGALVYMGLLLLALSMGLWFIAAKRLEK